jgi:hypothetical protein
LKQDDGTDGNHRIFAVTVQDPQSTAIWNILRVDRNNTEAFKQTFRHLKEASIRLRAITSDGWPAILRAVREELAESVHLLCHFHAKKNIFETLEKYRKAKQLSDDAPELVQLRQDFFEVLDAPTYKLYRAHLRKLTRRVADEPILLARCKSLQKKSHYNTRSLVGCDHQPTGTDFQVPHSQDRKSLQLPALQVQRRPKVSHRLGSRAQLCPLLARRQTRRQKPRRTGGCRT